MSVRSVHVLKLYAIAHSTTGERTQDGGGLWPREDPPHRGRVPGVDGLLRVEAQSAWVLFLGEVAVLQRRRRRDEEDRGVRHGGLLGLRLPGSHRDGDPVHHLHVGEFRRDFFFFTFFNGRRRYSRPYFFFYSPFRQVERNVEAGRRSRVCRALCHSSATSDRFYVAEASVVEAHALRADIDDAVGASTAAGAGGSASAGELFKLFLSSDDSDDDDEGSEVCN